MAKKKEANMSAAELEQEARRLSAEARKKRRAEEKLKQQQILNAKVQFVDRLIELFVPETDADDEKVLSELMATLTTPSLSGEIHAQMGHYFPSSGDENVPNDVMISQTDSPEQRAPFSVESTDNDADMSQRHYPVESADIEG